MAIPVRIRRNADGTIRDITLCPKQEDIYAEKFERLEKQLAIAVEALNWIIKSTKTGHIQCDACCYEISCEGCSNQYKAQQALQQIKELENG